MDRREYGSSSGWRESRYQVPVSDPLSRFGVLQVPAPESRLGNYTVPDPVSRSGVYTVPTDPDSRFGVYTVPTVPDPASRLGVYPIPNPESRIGVYPVPEPQSRLGVYPVPEPQSRLGVYTISDPDSHLGVYSVTDPESRIEYCTETDPESKLGAFSMPDSVIREQHEENSTGTGSLNCCPPLVDIVQPCMAELLGTLLLIFVDCSARIGNSEAGAIQPALAVGLIWIALIMAIGHISGGHYNPALSLTVCLCGRMQLTLLGPYILAQILGAVIGAALAKPIYPYEKYIASHGGAFYVKSDNLLIVAVAEGILTLVLMSVVYMVSVNEKTRSQGGPFCIGFTLTAIMFAGGVASGGCMNPARAFGPAVSSGYWFNHWVYWVGPTCGALLSVCLIRLLFDKTTRIKF